MGKLTDFIKGIAGPKLIISSLKNQDPEALSQEAADMVDEFLDGEFGNKKSEEIKKFVVPFANRFVMGFCKRLLEDQKK